MLLVITCSCAKQEEFPIGSLKLNTTVTNVTPTSVMIQFEIPENSVVDHLESLYLFDEKGNPVTLASGINGNEFYIYGTNLYIEGLKRNTTYKYKIACSKNPFSYNGLFYLSDPSFTFTTSDSESKFIPSFEMNDLNFEFKGSLYNNSHCVGDLKFNLNYSGPEIDDMAGELTIYVSTDPKGLNCVYSSKEDLYMRSYYRIYDIDCLNYDTTYYVFAKINGLKYILSGTNESRIEIDDVIDVPVEPNSFTTPSAPSDYY